ncbi:MAG: WecB/TagA/CpsF family glycosyl transferase [Dehalococcoidia bacterium]|nr:MAG: WecB/TagA/CpsF family glycosyl transferase [Dehalococcoidia bacterium]
MNPLNGHQLGARRILGVRVDDVTMAEAVALIGSLIAARQPSQVVTINPEFVMRARRDPTFAAILEAAALAVPDGSGLAWACRRAGLPLRGLVRGVELVEELARAGAAAGWRFFLLGAAEGVAAAAGRALARHAPGLTVAGTFAGNAAPAGDAETTAAIRAACPIDLLLVAYGAPAQERWIARNAAALGIPVSIGVGGTFDYLSGRIPRAPRWAIEHGLEWLFRLLRQPWRWRRQRALLAYAWLILRDRRAVTATQRTLLLPPLDRQAD